MQFTSMVTDPSVEIDQTAFYLAGAATWRAIANGLASMHPAYSHVPTGNTWRAVRRC